MNVRGIIRYTASLTSVGTGTSSTALTGSVGPPARGKILRIAVAKTAGPATEVTFRLREGGAGAIRVEFTSELLDADVQPLPASYEVSTPSDLLFTCETDDGTNLTDLDIEVDIEGPY